MKSFLLNSGSVSRWGVPVVVGLMLLAGCSGADPSAPDTSPASVEAEQVFPALTKAEAVRDNVARSEQAISTAAAQMAVLATECEDCAATLTTVSAAAQERLVATGGLWMPWPQEDPEEAKDLPQLPEVGAAPELPGQLAAYMYRTARDQMRDVAMTPSLGSDDSVLFASLLAGRLASTVPLERQFPFTKSDELTWLPEGAVATAAGPVAVVVEDDPDTENAQSGEAEAGAEEDTPTTAALVSAVSGDFSCLAATLAASGIYEEDVEAEERLYDDLLSRQAVLAGWSEAAPHPVRCLWEVANREEFYAHLLRTDLALLGTFDTNTRSIGAQWLLDDIETWSREGTPPLVTPGLVAATPSAEEAPDEQ